MSEPQEEPTPEQIEDIKHGLEDMADGRRFTSDEMQQQIKAAHEIGAVAPAGDHKGEIYCGIWTKEYGGDNEPIWVSQFAPTLMNHFDAASWANSQGGALPTRKQGEYLETIKNKGAFKDLFNQYSAVTIPAGCFWLAESDNSRVAWCQRPIDGLQGSFRREYELPVFAVRR